MSYIKSIYRKFLQEHDSVTGSHTYAYVCDLKTSATEGGDAEADTWNARVLNTILAQKGSRVTLDQNKIVLSQVGTYHIHITAPVYGDIGLSVLRLYNVTDAVEIDSVISGSVYNNDIITGEGENIVISSSQQNIKAEGIFSISKATSIRIEHYTQQAVEDVGLGKAIGLANTTECYTQVYIEQIEYPLAETEC